MVTPLRTLAAVIIAFALIVFLLKTKFLPRGVTLAIALCFWAVFRWVSSRTSKAARAQHQDELEQLRHKRVLNLDDENV